MNRNDIQGIIDNNCYDNTNREILAQMLRTIFEALKNGYFNLDEDVLQNQRYNSTQTLSQFFATLPNIKKGRIGAVNISSGGVGSIDVSGAVLQSASLAAISGPDYKLTVNFTESIVGKSFLFSLETDAIGDVGLNTHNDVLNPVWRLQTPTSIDLGIRILADTGTRLFINIFVI